MSMVVDIQRLTCYSTCITLIIYAQFSLNIKYFLSSFSIKFFFNHNKCFCQREEIINHVHILNIYNFVSFCSPNSLPWVDYMKHTKLCQSFKPHHPKDNMRPSFTNLDCLRIWNFYFILAVELPCKLNSCHNTRPSYKYACTWQTYLMCMPHNNFISWKLKLGFLQFNGLVLQIYHYSTYATLNIKSILSQTFCLCRTV